MILNFVRVLDQRLLRRDDVAESKLQPTDRAYWLAKSTPVVVQMADEMLEIINRACETKQQLNYNRYYIGLTDGVRSRNFIYFRPRKKFLRVVIPGAWSEELSARLEQAGLEADQRDDNLVFNLLPTEQKRHADTVASVVHEVVADQDT